MNKFFIGLILQLTVFTALADQVGNGGGVFVCKNPKTQKISYEVLDIWEGRTLWDYTYTIDKNMTKAEYLEKALKKLAAHDSFYAERVKFLLDHIMNKDNQLFLPDGVSIAPPEGTDPDIGKKNCILEGAAIYNDRTDIITYTTDIVKNAAFDDFSSAALDLHEAVFKNLRMDNYYYFFQPIQPISVVGPIARRFTGCLLSDQECFTPVSVTDGLPTNDYFQCQSDNFQFYFWAREKTDADSKPYTDGNFLFSKIAGRELTSRHYSRVEHSPVFDDSAAIILLNFKVALGLMKKPKKKVYGNYGRSYIAPVASGYDVIGGTYNEDSLVFRDFNYGFKIPIRNSMLTLNLSSDSTAITISGIPRYGIPEFEYTNEPLTCSYVK